MADVPSGKVHSPGYASFPPVLSRSTGFTAIVDKALSAKYEKMVNDAPELIKSLPWGPDFEVDVFRKPDFTALEVLTFATGGLCSFSETPGSKAERFVRYSCWYQREISRELYTRRVHKTRYVDSQLLRDSGVCRL